MFETVASELPRILACNGSRLLGGSNPPSNSDPTARNEGIAAHWLIHKCYSGVDLAEFIGKKAPNGFTITNAIAASVAGFVQHVKNAPQLANGIETDCEVTGPNFRVACRTDFWSFDGQTLAIDDFRHGFRIVEPENNWTMISYALGIIQCGLMTVPQNIVLRIHQPRVPHPRGPVREYRLTFDELQNRYRYIAEILTNLNDSLNTGPHCDKCPSLTICPANRAATFSSVDISLTAHAENLNDSIIGPELQILQEAEKRLKARKKQLEDLAIHRLKQGAIIQGFAMESSFSNRAWKDEMRPDFLSAMLGVQVTKQEAITPAQAIAAGANETLVNQFSIRKETGLKLTRVSANDKAARMFGKG